MPVKRALLVLVFCASAALADPPELRPLTGDKFKGDLVSLNDKEIVLQVGGKPVTTPVEGVLHLDFRAPASPTGAYTLVELADGSIIRCSKVGFEKKDAVLTLLSGQTATVPIALLSSVMREAQDVKLVAAWKELLGDEKRVYDLIIIKKKGDKGEDVLGSVEGTFYDASADGKTIEFKLKGSEEKENLGVAKMHGLVFNRPPDPNMPGRRCEVVDGQGNHLFAKSVVLKDGKFVVQTQCGATVEYPADALAKLDYSRGKLVYLSDLAFNRVKVVQTGYLQEKPEFQRDRNVDGSGLRLAGQKYDKGLAMHARTELTFDLDGEYREFKAVAGIDENVGQGSDAPVVLRVEGDGKELKTYDITRKAGPQTISLNIKDVKRLRIIVDKAPEGLGLGSHLDLANAQVSK
jgi:hypothetical protein